MNRLPSGRLTFAVVLLMLAACAVGCSGSDRTPSASITRVVAPEETTAGSIVQVVIEGRGPGDVELDVIDAFAATTFTTTMSDDRATVTLPTELTSTSGLITFVARGGDANSDTQEAVATTLIVPGAGATEVDIHAGPRTIIADGNDYTMVTAIAADSFGNPIVDGGEVRFTLADTSADPLDVRAVVDHGLAAQVIGSDRSAGTIEVFATTTSGASSRRVGYDEVPGVATGVEAAVSGAQRFVADGRTLVEIETSVITDQFGNRVPDGRLVQLRSDGPNGVGLASATTIDGIARFRLLSPDRPGTLSVAAMVDGMTGETIEMVFSEAVSSIPLDIVDDDSSGSLLLIGPVLDDLGAVVADGTPVIATIENRVEPIEAALFGGVAEIQIEALEPAATIDVEVLGVSATVTR